MRPLNLVMAARVLARVFVWIFLLSLILLFYVRTARAVSHVRVDSEIVPGALEEALGHSSLPPAAVLHMVKDIGGAGVAGRTDHSRPKFATTTTTQLYFEASDGTDGTVGQLWVTSGMPESTLPLRLPIDSDFVTFDELTWYRGNVAYLFAYLGWSDNGPRPREIWRTEGTVETSRLVHRFADGENAGTSSEWQSDGMRVFLVDSPAGMSFGLLDMSTDVYRELHRPRVDVFGNQISVWSIALSNSAVYYVASMQVPDDETGFPMTVWRLRIVELNGEMVDAATFPSEPRSLVVIDDRLYFLAETLPGFGHSVWVTDGTPQGTEMIDEIGCLGDECSLHGLNGRLVIRKFGDGPDGSYGDGLWLYDPASESVHPLFVQADSTGLYLGQTAEFCFYLAVDNESYNATVWRTDGTADGSIQLVQFQDNDGIPALWEWQGVGTDSLFFLPAYTPETGTEIWVSDGTVDGTHMVRDIRPGRKGMNNHFVEDGIEFAIAASGENVYFVADDGTHGAEVWKSDGTERGTTMVIDLNQTPPYSSGGDAAPEWLTRFGDSVVFISNDSVNPITIYRSDGTFDGTDEMTLPDSVGDAIPNQIVGTTDEKVFYLTGNGAYRTLWATGGTAEEWAQLGAFEISPNLNAPFLSENDIAYFGAGGSDFGSGLWRSDGTNEGTWLVDSFTGGSLFPEATLPREIVRWHGDLYTSAGFGRRELWKGSGEAGSMTLLRGFGSDDDPAGVGRLTPSPDYLFFGVGTLRYSIGFHELWRTDGTESGTLRLLSLPIEEGRIGAMTWAGGQLFFVVYYTGYAELWRSDGTAAGTYSIKTIDGLSETSQLVAFDNVVFFAGVVVPPGQTQGIWSLWLSDGAPEHTNPIMSTAYFPYGIDNLAVWSRLVLFRGTTEQYGRELYAFDPAYQELVVATDVNPGSGFFAPDSMLPVGDQFFFVGDDGVHGQELWVLHGLSHQSFLPMIRDAR